MWTGNCSAGAQILHFNGPRSTMLLKGSGGRWCEWMTWQEPWEPLLVRVNHTDVDGAGAMVGFNRRAHAWHAEQPSEQFLASPAKGSWVKSDEKHLSQMSPWATAASLNRQYRARWTSDVIQLSRNSYWWQTASLSGLKMKPSDSISLQNHMGINEFWLEEVTDLGTWA